MLTAIFLLRDFFYSPFLIYAEESLEPMVQGLLGIIMPRRSVRRKKGSLNLFFFPPHPIFRIVKVTLNPWK